MQHSILFGQSILIRWRFQDEFHVIACYQVRRWQIWVELESSVFETSGASSLFGLPAYHKASWSEL